MRLFTTLGNTFKTSSASAAEPSSARTHAASSTMQRPASSQPNLYRSPNNSRAKFHANMARNDTQSNSAAGGRVDNGQQSAIGSETASPCSDIDHTKWTKLNANLAPFATARMEKRQAQDAHFSEDIRQQQGGIC